MDCGCERARDVGVAGCPGQDGRQPPPPMVHGQSNSRDGERVRAVDGVVLLRGSQAGLSRSRGMNGLRNNRWTMVVSILGTRPEHWLFHFRNNALSRYVTHLARGWCPSQKLPEPGGT